MAVAGRDDLASEWVITVVVCAVCGALAGRAVRRRPFRAGGPRRATADCGWGHAPSVIAHAASDGQATTGGRVPILAEPVARQCAAVELARRQLRAAYVTARRAAHDSTSGAWVGPSTRVGLACAVIGRGPTGAACRRDGRSSVSNLHCERASRASALKNRQVAVGARSATAPVRHGKGHGK